MERDHMLNNDLLTKEELEERGSKIAYAGKYQYKGKTLRQIYECDRGYCTWAKAQHPTTGTFLYDLVRYARDREQYDTHLREAQTRVQHQHLRNATERDGHDCLDGRDTLESFTSRYVRGNLDKGLRNYCWDFLERFECCDPYCRFKHGYPDSWTEEQRRRHQEGVSMQAMAETIRACESCFRYEHSSFYLCDYCSHCEECCACTQCEECEEKFQEYHNVEEFCFKCQRCGECRGESCLKGNCNGRAADHGKEEEAGGEEEEGEEEEDEGAGDGGDQTPCRSRDTTVALGQHHHHDFSLHSNNAGQVASSMTTTVRTQASALPEASIRSRKHLRDEPAVNHNTLSPHVHACNGDNTAHRHSTFNGHGDAHHVSYVSLCSGVQGDGGTQTQERNQGHERAAECKRACHGMFTL
jgi:hypothetical protein